MWPCDMFSYKQKSATIKGQNRGNRINKGKLCNLVRYHSISDSYLGASYSAFILIIIYVLKA